MRLLKTIEKLLLLAYNKLSDNDYQYHNPRNLNF